MREVVCCWLVDWPTVDYGICVGSPEKLSDWTDLIDHYVGTMIDRYGLEVRRNGLIFVTLHEHDFWRTGFERDNGLV